MESSDTLGMKIVAIAAALPMRDQAYEHFLRMVADYTMALRQELLSQLLTWAEGKQQELEASRPEGQHSSWDPNCWQQVIAKVRELKEAP